MSDNDLRRPSEVMSELGVSATTLRRWSKEFARFLSDTAAEARPEEGTQQVVRRYTEQDIRILANIKKLLAQGFTYEHVERQLEERRNAGDDDAVGQDYTLIPRGEESRTHPAFQLLSETMRTVTESQQAILNVQQSNRDLMGVVIQDNFNLKAENSKLRDRMLELEREMSELRRHHEQERREIEERLRNLELQLAAERTRPDVQNHRRAYDDNDTPAARSAPSHSGQSEPSSPPPRERPEAEKPKERRGFWSRLTGND